MTQHWTAFTDGASRGNPGPAGCGAFLIAPDGQEHGFSLFLDRVTNNVAEYQGCILALEKLVELGAKKVVLKADSQLMVNQLSGTYRVKTEHLFPLFNKAKALAKNFESISYVYVPREQNKEADKLANQAIDER